MKLPEDKKERIKIFILIGIGGVGVVYATVFAVLRPMLRSRREKLEGIEELTAKLDASNAKIEQMNQSRARNVETLTRIISLAKDEKYILEPVLGNYLLGAREVVERHAKQFGMTVELREVGISHMPQTSGDGNEKALNAYTVAVNTECGLHELINLLKSIESSNPFLCVSGISITGQANSPAAHAVNFQLQWPVWADPARLEKIQQDYQDLVAPGQRQDEPNEEATAVEGDEET